MLEKHSMSDKLSLIELIDKKVIKLVILTVSALTIVTISALYFSRNSTISEEEYIVEKKDLIISIKESGIIRALNNNMISLKRRQRIVIPTPTTSTSSTPPVENPEIIYMIPEGTIAQSGDTLLRLDTIDLLIERRNQDDLLNFDLNTVANLRRTQEIEEMKVQRKLDNIKFIIESKMLALELAQFGSENERLQRELEIEIAFLDSIDTIAGIESQRVERKNEMTKTQNFIDEDRIKIEEIENRIEDYTVIAEYPALVAYFTNYDTQQKYKVGDKVTIGRTILQLPDFSSFTADLQVNNIDRSSIWIGQEAQIKLEAYPDIFYTGKVTDFALISQSPSNPNMFGSSGQYSNIKSFRVNILIDKVKEDDNRLRPLMTSLVELFVKRLEKVIVVPLGAVFETNGETYVYVASGRNNGLRKIELGNGNEIFVEVINGLEEGETIVTKPKNISAQKLGTSKEMNLQKEKLSILNEQFKEIEDLGLGFDYDRARSESANADTSGSGI